MNPTPQTDTGTVRTVVVLLGIIALAGLAAIVFLASQDKDTNTVGLITTAASASLATLLASTRSVSPPSSPDGEPPPPV